jgi:hypothetical protein
LTQNGLPRVNEVRRIAKAMGWSADMTLVDGLPFPDLVPALIHALRAEGFAAYGVFAPSLKTPGFADWLTTHLIATPPVALQRLPRGRRMERGWV